MRSTLALGMLAVVCLFAQTNRGVLAGRVTDELGAPVARATVTIINANTREMRSVEAGDSGEYTIPQIDPGTYTVSARHNAYGLGSVVNVKIAANDKTQTNVTLKPVSLPGGSAGIAASQIAALSAEVREHPNDIAAHYRLGRALFARRDYDPAQQEFEKMIALFPEFLPPRLALVQLAIARGDNQSALRYSDVLEKIAPQSQGAKVLRAAIFVRIRQYGDARSILKDVLAANPKNVDALLELGALDLQIGLFEDAEEAFAKAYEVDGTSLRGLLGAAETWLRRNKPQKALELFEAEIKKHPERLDLRAELGTLEARAGQPDIAMQEFESALKSGAGTPRERAELYFRLAGLQQQKGDTALAIESMKSARDLAPDNETILGQLGLMLGFAGRNDQSRQAYEQVLRIDPNNMLALNNLAWMLANTGTDLDEALRLATRVKELLPKNPDILDTLAWVYIKKQMTDEALAIYRNLVAAHAGNAIYRYHFAVALLQKGDKQEALGQCETALQNHPTKEDEPQIRDLMAKINTK